MKPGLWWNVASLRLGVRNLFYLPREVEVLREQRVQRKHQSVGWSPPAVHFLHINISAF